MTQSQPPIATQFLISQAKLTQYLLILLPKNDKSKFLSQAGYTFDNWQDRHDHLKTLAMKGKSEFLQQTPYGKKYKIKGELQGLGHKTLKVATIWMVADKIAKFVTLIPDKGE
ncbi:hypothetical protein AWQ21_13380 [Picosynechococcus sp. PCC 7003]|uniref:DUF6883 domain-containing protein n=1 Tax=Picosynechococcus sp. PCC 7003 TaxID=374981 RepID=UPI00081082F8|nr:DUF6883 domain-containing protein [Picosynechococcus sp. PCC 7003]ANV85275.1 hypothetical protein AWQ21_13380 [Picosynechococcus sp. PCC 7003]